jgi:hypothetical protein
MGGSGPLGWAAYADIFTGTHYIKALRRRLPCLPP